MRSAYFGLGGIDAADKTEMRELVQRPGPHTQDERAALLAYCETDVLALAKLLPAMLPQIDLPSRPFERPLYGRRGGDGVERGSNRHTHAGRLTRELDGHQGPSC